MVAVLEQRPQYRGYRIHPRQRILKLQERQVKTATMTTTTMPLNEQVKAAKASMTEQVEAEKAVRVERSCCSESEER